MFNSLWFDSLNRPFLAPPSWIFSPMWTILYLMMFAALLVFVFKKTDIQKTNGYVYFALQLILNLIWSLIFFGLHNIALALIVLLLLDIFVFLTIKKFYLVSKLAGWLLVPYFVWILFATYLNVGYFVLN